MTRLRLSSGGLATLVATFSVTLIVSAGAAYASGALTTAVGAGDIALGGANLAEPSSVGGAQFANPAGLAAFEEPLLTMGAGFAYGEGEVNATDPAGYDPQNAVAAFIPHMAYSRPLENGWTFGASVHGTVGLRFDYDAVPAVGVDEGFLSEVSILATPVGVAKRVNDQLWLGAEIIPLFGYLRSHYPVPGTAEVATGPFDLRYKLLGPGIQTMFGATWKPVPEWSLGVSARPPGRIWMDGSTAVPGIERQDVSLTFRAPAQASAGVTRRLGETLALSYSFRWIDSSELAKSEIRFDTTPSLNAPFVSDAKDEQKHALGIEWSPRPDLKVRAGVSHAGHIVGTKGLSPLIFDGDDTRISLGIASVVNDFLVEASIGYKLSDTRRVSATDALILPGRYFSDAAAIVQVDVTRALSRDSR